MLEVLARVVRQERKDIQIEKEKVKLSLFTETDLYIEISLWQEIIPNLNRGRILWAGVIFSLFGKDLGFLIELRTIFLMDLKEIKLPSGKLDRLHSALAV